MNALNGHKPLIISTSISLLAILGMAYYLGAKEQSLETVRANQVSVISKLDALTEKSNARDLQVNGIEIKLQNLHEVVTDIQVSLRERKR